MNRFSLYRFALFITFALLLLTACDGGSPTIEDPPPTPIEDPPSAPIEEPPVTPVPVPPSTPIQEPPVTPIQVPLYAFTNLGVLEGYSDGEAKGINDRGQIVGSSWRKFDDRRRPWEEAFLWEDGHMRGLGVLPPGGEYSRAAAINNLGQSVGEGDNPGFHSFFWEADGTLRDLYLNQGNESTAFDINDQGQVVGFNFKRDYPQAYIYENGRVIELGAEFGESYAYAINNAGQVVGSMIPATGTTENGAPIWSSPRAFLWENGKIRDLGIFGRATDINEEGQIVGYLNEPDRNLARAFLWQDGAVTELGHLGGEESLAEAINDAGQVVGHSRDNPYDPENPESRKYSATLWERGRIRDLNRVAHTGGAHLQRAFDINNRGQIVGRALTGDTEHPFLLTPHWEGFITPESSFSTNMALGERLIFDYWADILPDSESASPFTIEVMVLDAAGSWVLLGHIEEQTASAAWKTAFVQIPDNLMGASKDLSLQLSVYHAAADPIIFVKSFRSQP